VAHQPFHLPAKQALFATDTAPDGPPEGERWSTWETATHGPKPRPDWVITDLGAVEADLGILKSGKEADVHVVRRWVPGTDRSIALAAKRFRASEHRMFHRDAGYLEGRRVRRSREMRAMARRTDFGKELITGQWAFAEFDALCRLWAMGMPVPYPVQLDETEMLMEFIGTDHPDGPVAAPRLHQVRGEQASLGDLWEQFERFVLDLADAGWAHGDLSPYNLLVHDSRLVVIDWPQVVDIVGNPQGFGFLERDVRTVCAWFERKGLAVDADELFGDAAALAASRA
jgi:Serine/threonine protein kinase involved in cell cycle control